MKTFTTSGTGSQQTLSPIETDKIPVYDSVTDAEADLANLAENQIIATHDTGSELSAPVDTVQSGNMHAVTSSAVAGALQSKCELLLNGSISSTQESEIDTDNYDVLYIDVNVDNAYHYTLYIPTALLTTSYTDYWLTGFYQSSASNMFIAIRLKKGYVKVAYVQKNGSNLTQLDNVKIYGIAYTSR